MHKKLVKDLMVPIAQYAVVTDDMTLYDAFNELRKALKNLPPGRQPYRAVLVVDNEKRVVGKIGQLAFLKALEPKYNDLGDLGLLSRAGVSSGFISSMMEQYRFFQDNLEDMIKKARKIKASEAMHPVTESIDENANLGEALHKIVMWQTLSIIVTSGTKAVGLLRLSDLFEEVSRAMTGPES
jgi:predicted transcriptional regulator